MKNSDIFGYTLLIFGLGIIAGLLVAPRKGEETRMILKENIGQFYNNASSFVTEKASEIKKYAGKYEEEIRKSIGEA